MKQTHLTIPEVGLIAATRGMMGAGLALLALDQLPKEKRKALGWSLFLVGAVSTVPLVADVIKKTQSPRN